VRTSLLGIWIIPRAVHSSKLGHYDSRRHRTVGTQKGSASRAALACSYTETSLKSALLPGLSLLLYKQVHNPFLLN
jgi:hypothetical protein